MTTLKHKGKLIHFYSPHEIEQIVPIEVRLPKSKDSGVPTSNVGLKRRPTLGKETRESN